MKEHAMLKSMILMIRGAILFTVASAHVLAQGFQTSKEAMHVRAFNRESVVSPNIRIHPSPAMQQFEVSITTHPANPNIVLVGAVTQDTTALMNGTMGWYYTTDGGATWSGRDTMSTHTNLNDFMGDPTVGIDLSGNLFIGGIYNDAHIFVDRSTNGGTNWAHTPAYAPQPGYHRPNLAIDTNPLSPYKNYLYVVNTGLLFSRSTDSGQSFSTPLSIGGTIGSWRKVGPSLALSPDSGLYVAWSGYDATSSAPIQLGFNQSTNGGISWQTARSIRTFNGVYPLMKNVQLYSAPSIAVDRSTGPRRGWIYIVYTEKSPTTPDIFLIRSIDKGNTWSSPVKVYQDSSGKDQWMPSISVDPSTGKLFVIYYDSRNFPSNDSAQVYVSCSSDGGENFKHILVSDAPFLPTPIRAPWDNDYMGQYISITALQGVVWPCWMDNRTGFHQAYVARIADSVFTSVAELLDARIPVSYNLSQNFPNPFNPSTEIHFSLPNKSHVTLTIFDLLGREVATLVSEELSAGSYSTRWDATGFPTGVYLYRLEAGEFVETKKLLLLR